MADVLKELDDAYDRYRQESDSFQRRKLQLSIQRVLIRSQELGDEKIQIAGQMVGKEHPAAALVELLIGNHPGVSLCNLWIKVVHCYDRFPSAGFQRPCLKSV